MIKIRVKPNSSIQKIDKIADDEYVVWLKSAAQDNKANLELMKVMKKHLGKNIKIIKGIKSRDKMAEVLE